MTCAAIPDPCVHGQSLARGLPRCSSGTGLHTFLTRAALGSRETIRSVTHSQAPFPPEARDSSRPPRAHSVDAWPGVGRGQEQQQETAPPRIFPPCPQSPVQVPWSRFS